MRRPGPQAPPAGTDEPRRRFFQGERRGEAVLGDVAEREHEHVGRERRFELGRERIPEEDLPAAGAGELEVLLDANTSPVEASQVEVPLILVDRLPGR